MTSAKPPKPPQPPEDTVEPAAPVTALPPAPPDDEPRAAAPEPESSPGEKSPALATVLAFVPFGLGHLYLGLYQRAMLFFTAFWFSIWLEMPLVAAFFYFFTIFDAYRQAQLLAIHGPEAPCEPARPGRGGLTLGVFFVVVGGVLLLRNWIDFDEIRYFLQDYSPALLVIVGIYLIFSAIKERSKQQLDDREESDSGAFKG